MITSIRILFAGLVFSIGTLVTYLPTQAAERPVIRFADIGNIADWHAESSDELFVQNLNKQWYRITFAPPCQQLPFAIGISFEPDSLGNLDNDSSILVEGERCYFRSIEETTAPVSQKGTEQ
jgi:hypothetical protein